MVIECSSLQAATARFDRRHPKATSVKVPLEGTQYFGFRSERIRARILGTVHSTGWFRTDKRERPGHLEDPNAHKVGGMGFLGTDPLYGISNSGKLK